MICNRCGKELPSDTPVCRACGPVTLDPGFASPPPLPPIPLAAPLLSSPVVGSAAAPAVTGREKPKLALPPPLPDRQSKAQRRRDAISRRTGVVTAPVRGQGATAAAMPTEEGGAALSGFARPRPITLLARLNLAVGAAEMIVGWAMLTGSVPSDGAGGWGMDRGALFAGFGLLMMIAAFGLFLLKSVGWYAQLAIVGAGLIWGSWSNLVGIALAVYVLRPGVRLLLSDREATSLSPQEATQVRKDTPSPILVPLAVAVQALIAAVTLLPILARIAFTP
jgi:hypothetical protein